MTNLPRHNVQEQLLVGDKRIGLGEPTYIIAEEGQANNGDLRIAVKMIDIAASAGADAIEFQFALADDLYPRNHPGYDIYLKREFSRGELFELFEYAKESGITAFATSFSSRLIQVLADVGCPLFNVNSSDIDNPDMLDAVAGTGLPFFVSTAMATIEDIDWATEHLRQAGVTRFALLHGQHVMTGSDGRGVPEHQTNMETMTLLRERYGTPVGFIDHTSSMHVPAIAAASGADVVSKHFTWDRSLRGPDWSICLEPEELAEAIRLVRLVDRTKGSRQMKLADGEEIDRTELRRSIMASTDLLAGTVLTRKNLRFKRPGLGISPRFADQLVGRHLKRSIKADDLIKFEDLL